MESAKQLLITLYECNGPPNVLLDPWEDARICLQGLIDFNTDHSPCADPPHAFSQSRGEAAPGFYALK
jgi:hypothetical protein